jgi:type I restriction enzyme M protein
MDAAEYKHIVLGLIFLKYISDSFTEQKERIKALVTDPKSDFFISEVIREYLQFYKICGVFVGFFVYQ